MSARIIILLVAATLAGGLMSTDAMARGGGLSGGGHLGGGFGGAHIGGLGGSHIGGLGGGHIGGDIEGLDGHIGGVSGIEGAHLGGLDHAHIGNALGRTGMVGARTHLAIGDHGRWHHRLGVDDLDDGSLAPYCDPETQRFHKGFPSECY